MRRYFEFPDAGSTLMLAFEAGDPAETATKEQVARVYKQTGRVREIGKNEFIAITHDCIKECRKTEGGAL